MAPSRSGRPPTDEGWLLPESVWVHRAEDTIPESTHAPAIRAILPFLVATRETPKVRSGKRAVGQSGPARHRRGCCRVAADPSRGDLPSNDRHEIRRQGPARSSTAVEISKGRFLFPGSCHQHPHARRRTRLDGYPDQSRLMGRRYLADIFGARSNG